MLHCGDEKKKHIVLASVAAGERIAIEEQFNVLDHSVRFYASLSCEHEKLGAAPRPRQINIESLNRPDIEDSDIIKNYES